MKPMRRGRRVQVAREAMGLTRSELALMVPCSRHTIFSIESGRRGFSANMAQGLETALDLEQGYLR